MSAASESPGTGIRPEVLDLAERLREGLQRRQPWAAVATGAGRGPVCGADLQALRTAGDLVNLPPLAKSGPLAWLVRSGRRLTRLLLRPWLAVQSDFNRQAVDILESLHREVVAL